MRYLASLAAMTVGCGSVTPDQMLDASSPVDAPGDSASSTCVQAPAGLRARYRAENNATDHAGNFNGTSLGVNFSYTPGKYGNAFQLDGVDDVVTIDDSEQLWPIGSFSLEAWIKTTASNPYNIVVCKYACGNVCTAGSSNSMFCLYTDKDGHPVFEFRREAGAGAIQGAKATLATVNDAAWHHLVGVRDVTALTGSLYVDGVLATTINPAAVEFGSMTNADGDTDRVSVGANAVNGQLNYQYWFAGAIDEVAVYHSALSATEVMAIYRAADGKCL